MEALSVVLLLFLVFCVFIVGCISLLGVIIAGATLAFVMRLSYVSVKLYEMVNADPEEEDIKKKEPSQSDQDSGLIDV